VEVSNEHFFLVVVLADDRVIILHINSHAERMFGWTNEEVVGKSVDVLMPFRHAHHHDYYVQKYKETGT
jgi:PAS domain S-box-containing protein